MRPADDLMRGTVFEQADEPAYLMDPRRDVILAANDAGCDLLAYSREELIGTPVWCIHPSEHAELSELLDRVVAFGRASTIRLTCRTKDGVFLPTEISLHAVELEERLYVLGLVQDRSEHRQLRADR
jgi:PAS domain S-box-containing protein